MVTRKQYNRAQEIIEEYLRQPQSKVYLPDGEEFKARRINAGLSTREVAEAAGTSAATVSRLETDKMVGYKTVRDISEYYSSLGH